MKRPLLISIIVTLFLDQLSKAWLLFEVGMINGPQIELLPFFKLVMVWNYGVSFGMFAGADSQYSVYILIAIAMFISGVLTRVALKATHRYEVIAYGMIIGGAMGNVIDRVRFGAVADFFYFHVDDLAWPAFNIADSAICLGVGFLLISLLKNSKVTES